MGLKIARNVRTTLAAAVLAITCLTISGSGVGAGGEPAPDGMIFSDVLGDSAEVDFAILCALGIISGPAGPGGPVYPHDPITREQFCKLVVEAFGYGPEATALEATSPAFADAHEIARWAWGYVNEAVALGIIKGYEDGTFRPSRPVTYAQAIAMLIRAVPGHDARATATGTWPDNYVGYGSSVGFSGPVVIGDPGADCSRGDAARMLVASMKVSPCDAAGLAGEAVLAEGKRWFPWATLVACSAAAITLEGVPYDLRLAANIFVVGAESLTDCVGGPVQIVTNGAGEVAFVQDLDGWLELPRRSDVSLNSATTFELPPTISQGDVAGVVVADPSARDSFVAVEVEWSGSSLVVTPVDAYRRAHDYLLWLFMTSGRTFRLGFTTERYPSFDPGTEQILEVPACPEEGFNFPYLLYVPAKLNDGVAHRLMVEPTNTGRVTDDLVAHLDEVRTMLRKPTYPRQIAEALRTPLLAPVFTRPGPGGEDTHSLERRTLLIPKSNPLHRIDLQMIAMIDDAKALLAYNGIRTKDKIFLEGFSSSGKSSNRFTLLHPELVRAVASGGVGGLVTLPLEMYQGQTLYYPVGIADLKDITGIEFNLAEYRKVAQFIHWGDADTNDPVPYYDCYELRERDIILALFGNSLTDRWAKTQAICAEVGFSVQFVTYKGVGHSYGNVQDVINFFRANDNDQDGITKVQLLPPPK